MGGSCSHSVGTKREYSRLLAFASAANYLLQQQTIELSILAAEQTIGAFLCFTLVTGLVCLRRCDTLNLTLYMSA